MGRDLGVLVGHLSLGGCVDPNFRNGTDSGTVGKPVGIVARQD